jgi:hypothetical protein
MRVSRKERGIEGCMAVEALVLVSAEISFQEIMNKMI